MAAQTAIAATQTQPILPHPPPTSPPSRRDSRPHGRQAITPSSARRCRSSARNSARRSISRPAQRCSMSPPATAWRASPRRGGGATSPRPTTCRRCWSAAGPAPRRKAWQIEFREADAENLPFDDNSFDTVLSTFGVMFTPNQDRAAAELMRVCKPKGQIGLANWTPEGFIGQVFKTLGKYLPPPAGAKSPALWGTRARLTEMFDAGARVDQGRIAPLQVPLPLAGALPRRVQDLLRPGAESVRRARAGETGRAA